MALLLFIKHKLNIKFMKKLSDKFYGSIYKQVLTIIWFIEKEMVNPIRNNGGLILIYG